MEEIKSRIHSQKSGAQSVLKAKLQKKLQKPEGEAKFSSVPNLTQEREIPPEEKATVATSVFERHSPDGDEGAEAPERDHLS